MELAQLDEILRNHRAAEARIAQNLVDLEARPTFGILRTTAWQGRSATQFAPALVAAAGLWPTFQAFRDVLAAARDRRGSGRRPDGTDRQSLEVLLTGPSVLIEAQPRRPEERTLLGTDVRERWATLDETVARMSADYDVVTDAVGAIERAWQETLPVLDRARAALADAVDLAADDPALGTLRDCIGDLEALLTTDPASVEPDVFAALDAARSIVEERRARAGAARAAWAAGMADARASLDAARRDVLEASAARSESLAKVASCADVLEAPPTVAEVDALASEIDALAARSVAPPPGIVDGLLARAAALGVRARGALGANRAPLVRRDELRGLLRSFEAKAGAAGRLEDPATSALVRAARDELQTAPTDLARAQAMIDQLAASLRQSKEAR